MTTILLCGDEDTDIRVLVSSDGPSVIMDIDTIDKLTDDDIAFHMRDAIECARHARAVEFASLFGKELGYCNRDDDFLTNGIKICSYAMPGAPDYDKIVNLSNRLAAELERRKIHNEYLQSVKNLRMFISVNRKEILERIGNRDGFLCHNCGSTDKLEIDHVIPLSRGGTNDDGNLQILCKSCNCKKHDKLP